MLQFTYVSNKAGTETFFAIGFFIVLKLAPSDPGEAHICAKGSTTQTPTITPLRLCYGEYRPGLLSKLDFGTNYVAFGNTKNKSFSYASP
jgi:hypothetical protein